MYFQPLLISALESSLKLIKASREYFSSSEVIDFPQANDKRQLQVVEEFNRLSAEIMQKLERILQILKEELSVTELVGN